MPSGHTTLLSGYRRYGSLLSRIEEGHRNVPTKAGMSTRWTAHRLRYHDFILGLMLCTVKQSDHEIYLSRINLNKMV